MNKKYLFIFLLFLASTLQFRTVQAVKIQIVDFCSKTLRANLFYNLQKPESVGDITFKILYRNRKLIPFQGTSRGINQIFNSPIGDEALELIDKAGTKMNAYGWCYGVNNVRPEKFPDKVIIKNQKNVITWWYGYAHYDSGKWVSQCVPSYKRKPRFLCQKQKR